MMDVPSTREEAELIVEAFAKKSGTIGLPNLVALARIGLECRYPSEEVVKRAACAIFVLYNPSADPLYVGPDGEENWRDFAHDARAALSSLTGEKAG